MGLVLVEMVLTVETEFNLHIPDEEASELDTPGRLAAYVCRRLHAMPVTCPSQRAFHRLRRELVRRGVARGDVAPAAAVADLVPPGRAAWKELSAGLGLRLPDLVRSFRTEVGVAVLGVGAAAVLYGATTALLVGAPALWAAARVTSRPLAVHLPASCRTVGHLVKAVIAENAVAFAGRDRRWTEAEVWERIVEIVVEHLGVSEAAVTPDAHFVHDLGAD